VIPSIIHRRLTVLVRFTLLVIAFTSCSQSRELTVVQLVFPDGRVVSVRLPSELAEASSRELTFYVQQGSYQALVVVTDDREERRAAGTGEPVSVAGTATDWRLVRGEMGLVDRIIQPTGRWSVVIGLPMSLRNPEAAASLVKVVEHDGLPAIELGDGTRIGDSQLEEPTWRYTVTGGEWTLTAISSCDNRPRIVGDTSLEWCDAELGLHLHAFGDRQLVLQIRDSLEIIVPFVGSSRSDESASRVARLG
jgi:hypothetical protein